jgi:hypothetical protein
MAIDPGAEAQIQNEIEDALAVGNYPALPALYQKLADARHGAREVPVPVVPSGSLTHEGTRIPLPINEELSARYADSTFAFPPSNITDYGFGEGQEVSHRLTQDINSARLQDAWDFYISATTENLMRDMDPSSLQPPSSWRQSEIFVKTEQMLRDAGLRGDMIPAEFQVMNSEGGLMELADQQGLQLSPVGMDPVEDQFMRAGGANDALQAIWWDQGALLKQGMRAETYWQKAKDYEDEMWRQIRGGGGGGPTYNAPERRTVEDAVSARLKLLVGAANESRVNWLTDMYMQDHRASWDSQVAGTGVIDPLQTVKEEIRKLPDYMEIHQNRPEDMDEDGWLAQHIADLRVQGLQFDAARERGIKMATVGATGSSVQEFQTQRLGGGNFLQNAAMVGSIVGKVMR